MGFSASGAGAADQAYRELVIDGSQVRWAKPATAGPLVLRYAIADTAIETPGAINCGRIRQPTSLQNASHISGIEVRRAVRTAFDRWQAVADVTFVEVNAPRNADIVIGEQGQPTGIAFTNVTLGAQLDKSVRAISSAQICLNPERTWKIGVDGNDSTLELGLVITHEIGHVLGLDHPSARGQIMSFKYQETLNGLTDGDRKGAVALYGSKR